jgi:hypothetical protein
MTDHRHDDLERLLRDAAPRGFADGFAGRVTARLAGNVPPLQLVGPRELDFGEALQRQFVRIVPILAAASMLLGVYSWWNGRGTADSLIDATLNLPQVSIATVYTPDLLFGETDGSD